MAKKEKKNKDEKKQKGKKGKEKKVKKRRRGKKGAEDAEVAEAAEKDNWLYYSEGPVAFMIAVLLVLCVLDMMLAIYAILYTKRVERDNIAMQNVPVIEETINGTTWFQTPDGTYVHADGTTGSASSAPELPQSAGSDTAAEGESGEGESSEGGEAEAEGEQEPAQNP
ncbi:MAG: hypothetical protein E7425_02530 [Ruminococcaceae bacterium]|jgi:hypothetical protein|nr:hypothetical protein [Oscillospiraceae bacterium]